jgi:GT2 family glycosyltransferase
MQFPEKMRTRIIILTYNRPEYTEDRFGSTVRFDRRFRKITIWDNASNADTLLSSKFETHPKVERVHL